MLLHALAENDKERKEREHLIDLTVILLYDITHEKNAHLARPPRIWLPRRTIVSFDVHLIPDLFRFRSHEQLHRLLRALHLPDTIRFGRRSRCSGEELLLVGLHRLCSRNDLADMQSTFNREITQLSRMFRVFVSYMVNTFRHLLHDDLSFWVPYFPHFAEKIRMKAQELSEGALEWEVGLFLISGFLDCVNEGIARVGAGPLVDGPNAPRADPTGWLQRVHYNGWLGKCAMKYGTVGFPCGMIGYASEGMSSRRNDLRWLAESNINQRLLGAQQGVLDKTYKMYGDSIFPWLECVHSRYRSGGDYVINEREKLENRVMSSCRESEEWHYAEIKTLFPFVTVQDKQQLLRCPVRETFLTCIILRNCYVCLNGNKTSTKFQCQPPQLEEWLRMNPNA
jgi:DDE superfamily endonuclease